MSQADVEVVVDQFDAVNERDFQRGMDGYTPTMSCSYASPDSGPKAGKYEGKEEVGRVVR